MLDPRVGATRAGRILVLALVALAVTVGGHVAADGSVSTLGIAVVGTLMLLVAVFATAVELSAGGLFAFIASAQVGAHFLLGHLGGHAGHGSSSDSAALGGANPATLADVSLVHNHGVVGASSEATSALGASFAQGVLNPVLSAAPMVFSHAVVALAMAIILRAGERTFFNLHRLLPALLAFFLGAFKGRIPQAALLRTRTERSHDQRPSAPPCLLLLGHDIARRGPPTALALP